MMIAVNRFIPLAMSRSLSMAAMLAVAVTVISAPVWAQDKTSAKQPVLIDAIVAVVNTEVVTLKELNDRMALIEQRMKRQNIDAAA